MHRFSLFEVQLPSQAVVKMIPVTCSHMVHGNPSCFSCSDKFWALGCSWCGPVFCAGHFCCPSHESGTVLCTPITAGTHKRAVQTSVHQAFPSTIALWFAEVLWMCTSYFNTQCFKKMCIHELKFYEINNFGCSKDILKWNWHLKIRVPLGEEYYYLQSLDC